MNILVYVILELYYFYYFIVHPFSPALHRRSLADIQSGSTYKGDFLLGVFHGRGRFESANANVSL